MPRDFLADDNNAQPESYQASPRDFLEEAPRENKTASVALAIPRIGEDLIKGGYQFIKNTPQYYKAAKEEIPNLPNALMQDPKHAGGQALAGLAELGKNIFNTPHDVINYLTNRLHLFPEELNKKVQMARMPEQETEQAINSLFGQPKPGESLIRGAARNSLNLLGGGSAAKSLYSIRPTVKGITKNVLNELNNQVEKHSNLYNNLWQEAEKKGLNNVPYDFNNLGGNYLTIEKYTTPKQHKSLVDFINKPTLANAQKAQSDLGIIRRAIEEKSRTTPLLSEERKLYDSLYDAEKHIEQNMFKDASGNINQKLANKYNKITNSYRENVVPYRYNPDIQSYLNKELTAKELVQRLNKGEFAAKKGSSHPGFAVRNALVPLGIVGAGMGTLGGAKYLYDQLMGNSMPDENGNQ